MEENRHSADSATCRPKCISGLVPFLAGLVPALLFGWLVFPGLLFSKADEPFYFSHSTHLTKGGATCADCHRFRDDGSFTGVPQRETCLSCHDGILTPEPGPKATEVETAAYTAEKTFMEGYVKAVRDIPWVTHQKQPDNVFFSHAAHFSKCYTCHLTMKDKLSLGSPEDPQKLCMTCHPSTAELDKGQAPELNILTGYSRSTLKMSECERCHAHPGHFYDDGKGRTVANNACYTCHK
ncbi:MAG: cytochrome c family protein [Desulfovibrio sp.]|nr:cytochrome c family protein [Desulfovibrio sp.]